MQSGLNDQRSFGALRTGADIDAVLDWGGYSMQPHALRSGVEARCSFHALWSVVDGRCSFETVVDTRCSVGRGGGAGASGTGGPQALRGEG